MKLKKKNRSILKIFMKSKVLIYRSWKVNERIFLTRWKFFVVVLFIAPGIVILSTSVQLKNLWKFYLNKTRRKSFPNWKISADSKSSLSKPMKTIHMTGFYHFSQFPSLYNFFVHPSLWSDLLYYFMWISGFKINGMYFRGGGCESGNYRNQNCPFLGGDWDTT